MITQERLKELLTYEPETGNFIWNIDNGPRAKNGSIAGCINKVAKYIQIRIDGKGHQAHRLAFLYITGDLPTDCVDHINGQRSDNRWCNLRTATYLENSFNKGKQPQNKSGFKGVSWNKASNKWIAQCQVRYKKYRIGVFDNPEEAHQAYVSFASSHHKEFFNSGQPHE